MRNSAFNPLRPRLVYDTADAGAQAGAVGAGTPYLDVPIGQLLLDARRAYDDEVYQNLMAYAAQLQVLGVLAGVIDGPTEEYRAAVAAAAGSYFSNLAAQSQVGMGRPNITFLDYMLDASWMTAGAAIALFGDLSTWGGRDGSPAQRYGPGISEAGRDMLRIDPQLAAENMVSQFLQSLWNDCVKRWDQFWDDFDREGLLSAMARLQADAEFLVAELAIDVALTVVTGGAAAAVRIVARRVSTVASRVVIRSVDAGTNSIPDAGILHTIELPDAEINDQIVRQVLDEENLRTRTDRGDLTDRAEVDDPGAEVPSGGSQADTPQTSRDPADIDETGESRPEDAEVVQEVDGDVATPAQPRSRDELLPNGEVPSNVGGEFADWWDGLSYQELQGLLQDPATTRTIGNRIRNGGGEHEWLQVQHQLEHKRLGFSMLEIQDWVTGTDVASGPLPVPLATGETRWRHNPEGGGQGSGRGSKTMHNALTALYDPPPTSRNQLLTRMGYFANHYLDGGIDGLPAGLRDAILQSGGG